MKKILIAADHGGFDLKRKLIPWLKDQGYEVEDCGAYELDEQDDYPDFAFALAEKLVKEEFARGILLCRSGAGMCIAANKVKGIRCADAYDAKSARHGVEHNNANVISVSADWLGEDEVRRIIEVFLEARFAGEERHKRRLNKIANYSN